MALKEMLAEFLRQNPTLSWDVEKQEWNDGAQAALANIPVAAPGEVARVEGFTGDPFDSGSVDAPQNSEPKE